MCYYVSISVNSKIIETRFGVKFTQSELFKPIFSASAFTYPLMPIISNENPSQISPMYWGLIPFWVKDENTARSLRQRTLNARSETIFTKPMFKHSIQAKRCLVLVDGFFEWRHFNNKSYPYYIRLSDHQPFALAGIWDKWQNPDTKDEIKTFSVITTEANSLLAEIHNTKKRMPVILSPEYERTWLANDLGKAEIAAMLKPYAGDMAAYPVDRSIQKLGLNISYSNVINEKHYDDLPLLQT